MLWDEVNKFGDIPVSHKFVDGWVTTVLPGNESLLCNINPVTAKIPINTWKAALRGIMIEDNRVFLKNITAPCLVLWVTADQLFTETQQGELLE